jgi:hypothetical protein
MGALRLARLAAATCCLLASFAGSTAHAADRVQPRSADAFRDSVGVSTHIVYYSTPYGNWPLLVDRLQELGIRHLRDGTYANPGPQWRAWNERYYEAVEYAADHGLRFNFGLGSPGYQAGTLDQLIDVVAGRLRRAAEAVEGPNEFDKYVGGRRWPAKLASYSREIYRKVNAHPSLRRLPVVGPSLATPRGPAKVGDQSAWLDRGNIHPYAGGASPRPSWIDADRARMAAISGDDPVWATEAGFHNAVHAKSGMPPTSESAAAVYVLRTVLEHFEGRIARTYLYELIDIAADPRHTDPNSNFGLLRSDYSRKPAFNGLKNLLRLVGDERGRAGLRPLRMDVHGAGAQVRHLLLQKADGSYVLALWRLAPVWDRDRRRALTVPAQPVRVELPGIARVAVADPLASDRFRGLRLRHGSARVRLGGRPLLLQITRR